MTAFFSSPHPLLVTTIAGPVATIAIDNPDKFNAVDYSMWQALPALLEGLGQDPAIRVIVLRGGGDRTFVSGADISEFSTLRAGAEGGRRYEATNEAAFHAVAECPKPVIAMIRGFCLGGGVGLALSCDMRIASDTAVFGVPAGRLGIGYPPGAMRLITAAIGAPAAKDLLYTGRRVAADEALRLGIVQRLVPDADLEDATEILAHAIARNAPLTIRAAKAAIDEATGNPHPGVDAAALADACFDSQDAIEGRQAFLEKREPVFKGT